MFGSLESIFKIAGTLRNSALSALMFRHVLNNPSMASLVVEN